MDKTIVFNAEDKKRMIAAMKPGIFWALHERGLLTGEQLDKLLSATHKV